MYVCIVFGVCVYLHVFLYVFQVYDVEDVCTKKTAFSLHTDQIDITVAFILEIAIEQTFVLKCQRKCHYRNLPYMLAPLPSPHSTSSSLFKLSPLPKQTTFSGFGLCLFARTLAHPHTFLLVSEDISFSGGACGAQPEHRRSCVSGYFSGRVKRRRASGPGSSGGSAWKRRNSPFSGKFVDGSLSGNA